MMDWCCLRDRLRRLTGVRLLLVGAFAVQVVGCSSPEQRAQSYYERGLALLSSHQDAKAALEFRNAVRIKRDLIGAWKALAEIDEAKRNWSGTATDLQAIVKLMPADQSARLRLAKLLLLAGATEKAQHVVDAGVEIDQSSADLHALKAVVAFRQAKRAIAADEARTAIALDRAQPTALMILAIDRLNEEDAVGAVAYLNDVSFDEAGSRTLLSLCSRQSCSGRLANWKTRKRHFGSSQLRIPGSRGSGSFWYASL